MYHAVPLLCYIGSLPDLGKGTVFRGARGVRQSIVTIINLIQPICYCLATQICVAADRAID